MLRKINNKGTMSHTKAEQLTILHELPMPFGRINEKCKVIFSYTFTERNISTRASFTNDS